MNVGEVDRSLQHDEVLNITIDDEESKEIIKDISTPFAISHASPSTPEKYSPENQTSEMPPPTSPPPLKERTLSVEMTEAIEALHRAEEAEQLLTPTSIRDNEQHVDSSGETPAPTHIPTTAQPPAIQALHRSTDQDADPFSPASEEQYENEDEAEQEKDTDTDTDSKQITSDLEIIIPDSPSPLQHSPSLKPHRSTSSTLSAPLSTPSPSRAPAPSPARRPPTTIPPTKHPWSMEYICYACSATVCVRGGGGGMYDAPGGAHMDAMRCRECGCRVMWKKRTERMVQFEAR